MGKVSRSDEHREPGRSSGRRSDRRLRRRAEIRERLIDSALRLFAERGFRATTIEEITELADVGKGTFFNYFPCKECIFGARVQRQVEKVQAFVAQARSSPGPMSELLYRLVTSLTEGVDASPAIFQSIPIAVFSDEGVRAIMVDGLSQARNAIAELMSLGQQRGEIRDDLAPAELAADFQRAFFGTVFLWSIAPSKPLADCLKETLDILWSAVRRRPEQ